MEGSTLRETREVTKGPGSSQTRSGEGGGYGVSGSQGAPRRADLGRDRVRQHQRGQENKDWVQREDDSQPPRGFRGAAGTEARGLRGDKVTHQGSRIFS